MYFEMTYLTILLKEKMLWPKLRKIRCSYVVHWKWKWKPLRKSFCLRVWFVVSNGNHRKHAMLALKIPLTIKVIKNLNQLCKWNSVWRCSMWSSLMGAYYDYVVNVHPQRTRARWENCVCFFYIFIKSSQRRCSNVFFPFQSACVCVCVSDGCCFSSFFRLNYCINYCHTYRSLAINTASHKRCTTCFLFILFIRSFFFFHFFFFLSVCLIHCLMILSSTAHCCQFNVAAVYFNFSFYLFHDFIPIIFFVSLKNRWSKPKEKERRHECRFSFKDFFAMKVNATSYRNQRKIR